MPETRPIGALEGVLAAVASGISNMMSKKFGVAVVAMVLIAQIVNTVKDVPEQDKALILTMAWMLVALAAIAIVCQTVLDVIERIWLKTDLRDNNGNGNGAEVEKGLPS